MEKKYKKLIYSLLDAPEGVWMTAEVLAAKLNVSRRSILTYIQDLKERSPNLIMVSRKGYRLNRQQASVWLEEAESIVPDTPSERVRYTLLTLLKEDNGTPRGLNLYELAEHLHVSYETVKRDLIQVKKYIADFDLLLAGEKHYIFIDGKETDKRKLYGNLLYDDFSNNLFNIKAMENMFPEYDIDKLFSILVDNCKQYHYFVNEYSLSGLVLDIIIMIERVKNHHPVVAPVYSERIRLGMREKSLATHIINEIEAYYGVCFQPVDIDEFAAMLVSCVMKVDYENINIYNIGEFVGLECMNLFDNLKGEIEKFGFMDIYNPEFTVKFILHLKNLLFRLESNYVVKNPVFDHVRKSCPLVYECAVSLSEKIREYTGHKVDEHETSYIALHIGSTLGVQTNFCNKASCIIVFPQYYDYATRLLSKINHCFERVLVVNAIISSYSNLENTCQADFVLTTVQIPSALGIDSIVINPFLTERDCVNIQNKINSVIHKKKQQRLRANLLKISNPRFFLRNQTFQNEEEAIYYIVGKMKEAHYVDDLFLEDVLQREHNYSTAFGNIAVPHSMKMNADKTGLFVLLNEKPFPWGGNMVNITLLFAVNYKERALFYDIFDNLIVLLLESPYANKAVACNTYEEFIDVIVQAF